MGTQFFSGAGTRASRLKPCLVLVFVAGWLLSAPLRAAEPRPSQAAELDVRLVVDVSGSMATADPQGMLAPALQLFLEMLPAGSRAGVWTFAQQVNALVKHAPVTPLWRTQALIKTEQLPAVGLRTALGAALDQAAWDWQAAGRGQRHLILLTDGEVDLADSAAVNQAARGALLRERLPELAQAGFVVHTLALSNQGDVAFLKETASLTGGDFIAPENIASLPEDLMQLFARIGPADQIPIAVTPPAPGKALPVATQTAQAVARAKTIPAGGRFQVEAGLAELTVFMTKQAGQVLRVAAPDGVRYDRSRIPPESRWHVSERYDLLTLRDPMPGLWELVGGSAEVFSYGSVQLRLLDRPRRVAPGSTHSFGFVLDSGDPARPLARDFLQLVSFSAAIEADQGKPQVQIERNESGQRQVLVSGLRGVERAVLTLVAQGPTFDRVLKFPFEVAHPLRAELQPGLDEGAAATLWVTLNQPGLEPGSVRIAAGVRQSPAPQRWYPLSMQPAGMWRVPLPDGLVGRIEIELDVHAKYLNGGDFSYRTDALTASLPASQAQRFSFADSGRQDAPARLVDAAAVAAQNLEPGSAPDLDSDSDSGARLLAELPGTTPALGGVEAANATSPEPLTAAQALEAEQAVAPEPASVPLWFAGVGMLLPLLLVAGLGWGLSRLVINRLELPEEPAAAAA